MNQKYQYKYKELLTKYVLVELYFLKLKNKTGYYSLKGIIAKLGDSQKTTASEINEIAKYLEALGQVRVEFTFGDAFISITPAGIVQIEEELGTDPAFADTVSEKLRLVSGLSRVADESSEDSLDEWSEDSITKAKAPILALLNEMQGRVKAKFGDSAKDMVDDLEILKMELGKDNPEVEVLAIKLASAERMSLLKSYIPQLRELLNL